MGVKPAFFRRFKGVVQLIGSPVGGERHSAADKAFEMCEAEDISLLEALEGTYGGGSGNDEALQAKIDELERDNGVMADEIRRLQDEGGNDRGYEAALRKIWSQPQTRLAAGISVIVSIFVMTRYWIPFDFGTIIKAVARLVLYINGLYLFGLTFFDWISAEDRRNGSGVVFLKSLLIAGGLGFSFYEFFGTLAVGDWPGRPTNLTGAVAVLALTFVISISNAVPLLIKKLAKSEGHAFKLLRAWFV